MILGIQPRSGNMEEEDMDDESMPIEGRTGDLIGGILKSIGKTIGNFGQGVENIAKIGKMFGRRK